MNLELIKQHAVPILQRYGVISAAVFGSFARGEQNVGSDIDILIEYAPESKKTLFDLVELRDELRNVFQKDVDLLTEKAISPFIKEIILKEKQVIL